MTKKIQELALSLFLIMCSIGIGFAIIWVKPLLNAQKLLIEETRKNQAKLIQDTNDIKVIATELSYVTAVIVLSEGEKNKRVIQPADADELIEKSINTIESRSKRLGNLLKLLNKKRINESRGKNENRERDERRRKFFHR